MTVKWNETLSRARYVCRYFFCTPCKSPPLIIQLNKHLLRALDALVSSLGTSQIAQKMMLWKREFKFSRLFFIAFQWWMGWNKKDFILDSAAPFNWINVRTSLDQTSLSSMIAQRPFGCCRLFFITKWKCSTFHSLLWHTMKVDVGAPENDINNLLVFTRIRSTRFAPPFSSLTSHTMPVNNENENKLHILVLFPRAFIDRVR